MEPNPETIVSPQPKLHRHITRSFITAVFSLLAAFLYTAFLTTAPGGAFELKQVEVRPGMTVANIAESAKAAGVVRSSFLLYTLLTVRHDPTAIYAGVYTFTEPQSVFAVANQFGTGAIDDESVRLTIPEGMRVRDIADLVVAALPSISKDEYITLATPHEGYLYPETYFVPPTFTAADIVALQRTTYEERVAALRPRINESDFIEYEVLTLASIIEREANDEQSMRMVSGIFQNRLEIGMALQADASIEYTLDVPLNELKAGELAENLRELDSPYNTYKNAGLPPTPISNPGITAIKAVLEPLPSDYFYYLTDDEGNFYYAKTLSEHNDNISKYLR
jgi:UPF0755 protein